MTRAEFIGRVVQSLADNTIKRESLDAICEAVRIVHGDVAAHYTRQTLSRYRKRAGRKKSKGPTQHQLKIVEAVAWARFNGGNYDAVVRAAHDFDLRESVVWRAFEGKNGRINALLREKNLVPKNFKRGVSTEIP